MSFRRLRQIRSIEHYSYRAFTHCYSLSTNRPTIVSQPLLYGGYVYDRELSGPGDVTASGQPVGWYWLSVRHYDPSLKRFLQPDPSEQEGTRSYVYAGDDPLDAADPSGLGPFGTCIPILESCRLPTAAEAKRVGYGLATTAAGIYDSATFGGFSKLAGAVGAPVNTSSSDYQTGLIGGSVALAVVTGGTDAEADAAIGAEVATDVRAAREAQIVQQESAVAVEGGTESEGAERVFYSVQDSANTSRLSAGGEPWPTGLSKALLGEGFYAWGTTDQAEAYLGTLEARGATGLSIIQARISEAAYVGLRTLDLRTLDDMSLEAWMDEYSLYGRGAAHGLDHIIRETGNFGPEYYFSKDVFQLFRLQG